MNSDGLIVLILRHQQQFIGFFAKTFDGQFAIDHGDNNRTIVRLQGPIHDEHIAFMNPHFDHRIASDFDKESGGRMFDQMLIEVKLAFQIVFCR